VKLAINTGIVPKLMHGDVTPFPHTSSLGDVCLLTRKTVIVSTVVNIQVFQELRSLLRDLIPELILSQELHIHMGPIRSGSGVRSF